jgi:hypothetical protein
MARYTSVSTILRQYHQGFYTAAETNARLAALYAQESTS